MDASRNYRHFCTMARSLELLGERWSLLVVRDLLLGPRRFNDLMSTLAGITPARLTQRLKRLEAAGVVERDHQPGRREVRYRLTEAGHDLGAVVDALTLWGIRHAPLTLRPGEPTHPEHVLRGAKVLLDAQPSPPTRPLTWVWRFAPRQAYTLRFDGTAWALTREAVEAADITVHTTPPAWVAFLTTSPPRHLPHPGLRLTGTPAARTEFATAFDAAPRPI